jgi:predicted nucleic acid-binding protein
VCSRVSVVLPDDRLPSIYGRLLAELKRRGETIATLDLFLIAAAAIADDVDLVTADRRHFSRIPGLRLITY